MSASRPCRRSDVLLACVLLVLAKVNARNCLIVPVSLLAAGCQTNGTGMSAVGSGYTDAQKQYPCPTGYGGVMNGYLAAQAAQNGINCPTYAPPQQTYTHCMPDGGGGFTCASY
jgi:hypothetical protein